MGSEFPHGVSDPLHIIILQYNYINDYMYDDMKGVTDSVWEIVSLSIHVHTLNTLVSFYLYSNEGVHHTF